MNVMIVTQFGFVDGVEIFGKDQSECMLLKGGKCAGMLQERLTISIQAA